MLSKKDLEKLKEVLATKEEINKISVEIIINRDEILNLKQEVAGLRELVQALTVSVDKLVKAVSDLKTEYSVIANQLSRHEKWIQQLAQKLGIKLEY